MPSNTQNTGEYRPLHQRMQHTFSKIEEQVAGTREDQPSGLNQHTVLVGPMGAGKTTVGEALAHQLGLAFFDADDLFVSVYGQISEYFSRYGEPAFRRAEEDLIAEVLSHSQPFVLSLGGGAVTSAGTRRRLSQDCFVVSLQVDEQTALARLHGGEGRPMLAGDPAQNWERIMAERAKLYSEVSGCDVDTSNLDAQQVVDHILKTLDADKMSLASNRYQIDHEGSIDS